LAVVRIRGEVKVSDEIEDTLKMVGLKKRNTVSILPKNDSIIGMIRKIEDFVAWGEASEEIVNKLKEKDKGKNIFHLSSPKKGLKSVKKRYPKGDLGYRGEEINKLIERMI